MRIGGLASGMDTEGMIKELMNAQRIPLDKITQKKQYLEWQLDDYRAINRNLNDFSQNLFNNLILSSKLTQKTVNVSAPDDVAIRNVSSSSDFSGTIKVDQLATHATIRSAGGRERSWIRPKHLLTQDLNPPDSIGEGMLKITIKAIK